MWKIKVTHLVKKIIYPLSRWANAIGVAFLVVMMFFIVVDVSLRTFANLPLLGPITYEAVGFMMVILVFFGVAHCQVEGAHVTVDLVLSRLPRRIQKIVDSITYCLSIGLFNLVTWRSVAQAEFIRQTGTVSVALHFPVFPFQLVIAFGSALLSLVLLANLLSLWIKE